MFKRLGDANEEIFDVLLSKKQLLAALRFIRSIGPGAVASVSARRFLEAAFDSGDDVLFYTGKRSPAFAAARQTERVALGTPLVPPEDPRAAGIELCRRVADTLLCFRQFTSFLSNVIFNCGRSLGS